jgi:cytochrome b6-f complex iron-sulfur subunit
LKTVTNQNKNIDPMEKTEKRNEYSRKQFLRTAGSTALFATLGISFYGCGSATDAGDGSSNNNQTGTVSPPTAGSITGFSAVRSSSAGVQVDGNIITLDLKDEPLSKLKNVGEAIWLTDEKVLSVNVDGTTIRSFTAICSHASCSDNWSLGGGNFNCGCHGSRFNSSGGVVRGPAQRDLAEFTTLIDEDDVNIVTITKN